MHRYTFPVADTARVLVDLIHAVGPWNEVREAHVAQVSDTEIEGFRYAQADKGPVYFVAQFSRPFRSFGVAQDAAVRPGLTMAAGKQLQGFAEFDASSDSVVVAKVGLSWVNVAGARANLLAEIPSFDFDATRSAARATWNAALAKVAVEGGTDAELRTFYSALYHAQLSPFEFADRDGSYLGADGLTHSAEYTNYTFFSLWDAFRAVHPLLSLIQPERVDPIVASLIAFGDQNGGLFPTWGLAGRDWRPRSGLARTFRERATPASLTRILAAVLAVKGGGGPGGTPAPGALQLPKSPLPT